MSRAVSAFLAEPGKQLFLSFGHRAPVEQVALQSRLAGMGLAVTEVLPGFNEYRGAGVLAGVSQMIYAVTTEGTHSLVEGAYAGPLYTGDVRAYSTGTSGGRVDGARCGVAVCARRIPSMFPGRRCMDCIRRARSG